jgi:hypothetical protein
MKNNFIQIILTIIAAMVFGWLVCFLWLPWLQENRKTSIVTPEPRFTQTDFKTKYYDIISELTDTKNNVTYLIFNGKILLSKEPTSATKVTLLEELK